MITHFMIMQLNYPPTAVLFFGLIFEFVTFDIVPTEFLYEIMFGFNSDSISEQAENIGYESQYFIENSGSFFIYLILIAITQMTLYIIVKTVS